MVRKLHERNSHRPPNQECPCLGPVLTTQVSLSLGSFFLRAISDMTWLAVPLYLRRARIWILLQKKGRFTSERPRFWTPKPKDYCIESSVGPLNPISNTEIFFSGVLRAALASDEAL